MIPARYAQPKPGRRNGEKEEEKREEKHEGQEIVRFGIRCLAS